MYSVVDVEADEYYPTFLDLTRNLLDGKTGALYILYVRTYVCMYVLGVKQYGSMPYCVLHLSVLQYIAIL